MGLAICIRDHMMWIVCMCLLVCMCVYMCVASWTFTCPSLWHSSVSHMVTTSSLYQRTKLQKSAYVECACVVPRATVVLLSCGSVCIHVVAKESFLLINLPEHDLWKYTHWFREQHKHLYTFFYATCFLSFFFCHTLPPWFLCPPTYHLFYFPISFFAQNFPLASLVTSMVCFPF